MTDTTNTTTTTEPVPAPEKGVDKSKTADMDMELLPIPPDVKITYIRDDENPERVLTIVRRFDRGTNTVTFGWSVNVLPTVKCVKGVEEIEVKNVVRKVRFHKHTYIPGDQFSRKTGRNLALKMLCDAPLVVELEYPTQSPLKACLLRLAASENVPQSVKRICLNNTLQLKDFRPRDQPSTTKAGVLDRIMNFFRGSWC